MSTREDRENDYYRDRAHASSLGLDYEDYLNPRDEDEDADEEPAQIDAREALADGWEGKGDEGEMPWGVQA